MTKHLRRSWPGYVAVTLIVAVGFVVSSNLSSMTRVVHADPAGIKYTGAGACAAAACHGSPTPKEEEATRHNENSTWSEKDQHAKAFNDPKKGLNSAESKAIAGKMKIADAAKSERCTSCHALSGITITHEAKRVHLPADQIVAKGYSIEDGVSCDACHGPADKYLPKHTEKGWTANQRKTLGSQKLYDEWGLFDTKNLKFRANTCLSCHLKIDADMVAAGHPELPFELDSFSQGDWVHWRDHGAWFSGKAWSMGQVISLREAAFQLADRVKAKADAALLKDSYKQYLAHAITTRQIAKVIDPAAQAAIDAQMKTVAEGWNDAAKVEEGAQAIGKAANDLADKLEAKAFDQATTEALLKGVASEGATAGKSGFRPAEQFTFALKSLWGSMVTNAKPADGEAKMGKIDALYDPLGDKGTYKADDFVKAATEMGTLFPGGAALPLPAGGPAD